MDLTYFGLQRRPFPSTPDLACYYPASGHEQALSQLRGALADAAALVLLTGQAGTGKTLLCHCLVNREFADASVAFLTNSHMGSRKDLLQAVLYDLGLQYDNGTEQELRLRLTDVLLKNFAAGQKTLIVADEAQYLTVEALEELRLLCNLEAGGGKALQVVLAAQPSFDRTLSRPELASLRQRLGVRTRLHPLGVDEAIDYLMHHLRSAGGSGEEIFTEEALEVIGRATRGIPRLLNQVGHQALALAGDLQSRPVDAEVAVEVLAALGIEDTDEGDKAGTEAEKFAAEALIGAAPLADSAEAPPAAPRLPERRAAVGRETLLAPAAEKGMAYRLYDPPGQTA